jgi:putative membrane protein
MNTFLYLGPRRATLALALALLTSGAVVSANAASPLRNRQVSARAFTPAFAVERTGDTLRPTEKTFLLKATEISREQVRLAEVGVGQAVNSDVRSHALQMVTDFRGLHDALEALIRRKGGIAGAPVGTTSEKFQKLTETPGNVFDQEFIRTVAKMSNDTLTLFEQVVSDSKDADVRELAAAQLPMLRSHRTSLVALKKALD